MPGEHNVRAGGSDADVNHNVGGLAYQRLMARGNPAFVGLSTAEVKDSGSCQSGGIVQSFFDFNNVLQPSLVGESIA